MKKVASIISGVVLLATISTSCKKNYTCECTISCGAAGSETRSFTRNDTKGKAKSWCDGITAVYQKEIEGSGCSASCTLK
jgi:hypothetical protein